MKSSSLRLSLFILLAWMSSAALTIAPTACSTDCSQSKNTWLPRSFSSYSMHDITQRQSACKEEAHKINFTFLTEYMQNFTGKCNQGCKNLGSMPFWSGDNTLTIGKNDGKAQLDAYQLGLGNVAVDATGIAGKIQLDPKVQHVGTNMMMLYQQSKDERGLYFKLHAPLGAMSINPRLKELIVAKPDGEMSQTQTTSGSSSINYEFLEYPSPSRRYDSVSEAFFGGDISGTGLKGAADKPIHLQHARIAPCKQTVIRIADISASLGYNLFVSDKGLLGVAFKGSCPTGNVPTASYMLEPIFGRAGAWAVGAEISGAYKVWENSDESKHLDVQLQGEALHLMRGRTPNYRTFDLKKNGLGSKYMLVQEYVTTYKYQIDSASGTQEEISIPARLHSAANITTLPVLSKIAIEGSLAVFFDFHCNNWNAAVGAEFWGRSRECLAIDKCSAVDLRHPNLNNYAVLGRQLSSYHIDEANGASPANGQNIATYLCEPEAKINLSKDPVILDGSLSAIPAIGNPAILPAGIADARVAANRIPASLDDALDIAGAAASRAFTGKITGEVGYTWADREHMPSVKIIGGAELTNKTNNAIQYWNVGLIGSINF